MCNEPRLAHVPDDEFDPTVAQQERVKTGEDWLAVFKDSLSRQISDVDLMYTAEHRSVVCAVRFSPNGTQFATSCNRTTQLYDTSTGALLCVLDDATAIAGDHYIRCLCFSPSGNYIVTGAEDGIVRLWDLDRRAVSRRFIGHQKEVYGVAFSGDGRFIASGSGDSTICIWDVYTGYHQTFTVSHGSGCGAVTSVAFSPDGRHVAAGSLDTAIYIVDVQTGQLFQKLTEHTADVYSVVFTPDGRGIISASLDKTMKHWDFDPTLMTEGHIHVVTRSRKTFVGHGDYILSTATSPYGHWVVSGCKDKSARVWNLQTGETELMIKGHKNSVISVDLSPDGRMLVTGSGDWSTRMWRLTMSN